MASYSILIKRSAAKELESLQATGKRRVIARITALAENPRPPRSEKLSGEDKFRVRQGSLRILYEIDDAETAVTVVKIGHRRDVDR